jgi:hypothetical protein
MAVFSFVPVVPSGNGAANVMYAAQLAAGATSGLITAGNDMIVRIASTGPATVRFGTTSNLTTATATDILLPGPGYWLFDLGHQNNALEIYAFNQSTYVSVNVVQKN